jgi:hypothetical protein
MGDLNCQKPHRSTDRWGFWLYGTDMVQIREKSLVSVVQYRFMSTLPRLMSRVRIASPAFKKGFELYR